jgi:hypothetical protein
MDRLRTIESGLRIESALREQFEETLKDKIDAWLENARDDREEALAETLEDQFREELEDGLVGAINEAEGNVAA